MESQILPPKAAERYVDLERVGYGGMGEVFRARDTVLERDVAIKIIRKDLAAKEILRKRFQREVLTLSKVHHPVIVHFYNYHEEEGVVFYSMEFVEGESLSALIGTSRLDVHLAVTLVARLADGLSAVHAAGLVHRDLKPSNVLVSATGEPKVIDFGLATFAKPMSQHQLTGSGEMVGTLRYMPPEILSGTDATEQSDVYQLGIILYEVLTGVHPFSDGSIIDYVQGLAHQTIPQPSSLVEGVDGQLDQVVTAAIAPHATRRLPSAAHLRDALSAWLQGDTISLGLAPRPVTEKRRAHRPDEGGESEVKASGTGATGTHRFVGMALLMLVVGFFLSRLTTFFLVPAGLKARTLSNLLNLAAQKGDREEVVHLLEKLGAKATSSDPGGTTPLHQAARRGHVGVVRVLLTHGSDVTARTVSGATPLHHAARQGHSKVVRVLLDHGASPACRDEKGWTAGDWARDEGHGEVASLLARALGER